MKANRLALIGIILGLAGAVLLALFVSQSSDDASGEVTTVLVAGPDGIPAGTRTDQVADLVLTRDVPVEIAPQRALEALEPLIGQRAARTIGPGEILTTDQFATVGPASGGVVVPDGWEAVSVEARPAPGLEGYATTGSLVNLYMTGSTPAQTVDGAVDVNSVQAFTQLVLAHTEVLAVTRGTLTGEASAVDADQAAQGGAQVYLLRVRPEDVPTLVYAEQEGELWFSLVNADDPTAPATRFTFDDLEEGAITQSLQAARQQLDADRAAEEAERAAETPASTDDGTSTEPAEDPSSQ